MAATNHVLEGGVFVVLVDNEAVAFSTSASLNITHSPREIRNKTDGRWAVRKLGTLDVSGSMNMLLAFLSAAGSAIYNCAEMFADLIAGTEVAIKYTNNNVGDKEFTGNGILTGLNMTFGAYGENAEGDISFQGSGAWTNPTKAA